MENRNDLLEAEDRPKSLGTPSGYNPTPVQQQQAPAKVTTDLLDDDLLGGGPTPVQKPNQADFGGPKAANIKIPFTVRIFFSFNEFLILILKSF
jgi:hypothetical protein